MAFNTYADLKTALATWLARSDLTSYLDDFLALGEARLARDLRVRGNETSMSVVISSGVAAIPADFLELKHAYIDASPTYPLEVKDSQWIHRRFPIRTSESVPRFIAPEGANFIFGPYPDSGYTVKGEYYFKPTALSSGNTTNEWTTNAPDALLYACLGETAPFLRDDSRIQVWEAKYQSIKDSYMRQQKRQARRGATVSYK